MSKKEATKVWSEPSGVILTALAALTFLALVSFDPADLPVSSSYQNAQTMNFIGPAGAYWSLFLFRTFGMAAYIVPILMVASSVTLLMRLDVRWGHKIGWGACLLLTAAALLHLQHFIGAAWCRAIVVIDSPGGLVGIVLDDLVLGKYFGSVGAGIVLSSLYVASLILLFGLHPVKVGREIVQFVNDWAERRELEKLEDAGPLEVERRKIEQQQRKLEQQMQRENKRKDALEPKARAAATREADALPKEELKPEPKPEQKINIIDTTAPLPEKKFEPAPPVKKEKADKGLPISLPAKFENYELPPLDLLSPSSSEGRGQTNEDELKANMAMLVETLAQFDIEVTPGDITKGATITRYEVYPAMGVRVDRVRKMDRDLARAMKAEKINILAPIPGKDSVGIEIPNAHKMPIVLRELFEAPEWTNTKAKIPIAIGKDVYGKTLVTDLGDMPHLLIAGTTGSGKSVCINCILLSFLYRFSPEDLRLILVDPKQVEMQAYERVPHLVVPVVTDPKKVLVALRWVLMEMERRYKILAKVGVRNITSFNQRMKDKPKAKAEVEPKEDPAEPVEPGDAPEDLLVEIPEEEIPIPEKMPYVVVIIDELADLMMTAPADVETAIARLTAKARAAGIHLIVATQTPRREVVTGVIKTNIPSRIAFQVPSALDSRVILDESGAENLLGKGDLLYLPPGSSKLVRGQGAFVADDEVTKVVDFVAEQGRPNYEEEIHSKLTRDGGDSELSEEDKELIIKGMEIVRQEKKASTSLIQRRLRIGYNRAAQLVDELERIGVVSPQSGAGQRDLMLDLDNPQIWDGLIKTL